MNSFVDYVVAPGAARLDLVSRQVEQYGEPYIPGSAFYRPMQLALRSDIRLRTVHRHMDAAVAHAMDRQLKHFVAIRDGAMSFVRDVIRRGGIAGPAGRWEWIQPAVCVNVNPDFEIIWPDGTRNVVKVYYKAPPLTRFPANVGIRLMQLAGPSVLHGAATPCVVDARRGKIWRPARPKRNFDEFMRSEAAAYGSLYASLATAS